MGARDETGPMGAAHFLNRAHSYCPGSGADIFLAVLRLASRRAFPRGTMPSA